MTKATPAPDAVRLEPSDYVLVPREPTGQMLKAAFAAMNATPSGTWKRMKAEARHPIQIFNAKMRPRWEAMIAAAPAPATARGGDALPIAWINKSDFDDWRSGGTKPGWAFPSGEGFESVPLYPALASQPQATGGAVEREVLKHACEHCQRMTKVPAETLSLATQPAPSPGGQDGYVTAFYEIATMLGMGAQTASPADVWENEMRPRLEALVSAQPIPAAPSIQKGDER